MSVGTRTKGTSRPEEPIEEWIEGQLGRLLGLAYGARWQGLRRDAPGLVDVLCPESEMASSGLNDRERARKAEEIIRDAIRERLQITIRGWKKHF